MKRRIHKRSYLLLEIVCCLALISLVLFPLLKPGMLLYKEKKQDIVQLQQALLERKALAALKQKLYLHEIPFEQLRKEAIAILDIDEIPCQAVLHGVKESDKTSLNRFGLLVQVSLTCGTAPPSSHLLFIEGFTK